MGGTQAENPVVPGLHSGGDRVLDFKPHDIRVQGWRYFLTVATIALSIAAMLWSKQITSFREVLVELHKTNSDQEAGFWDSVKELVINSNGWWSLLSLTVASGMLVLLWHELIEYLCELQFGQITTPRDRARAQRAHARHEPPGDIFTLVGVGFTFVGLALSLLSLPTAMISAVMNNTSENYSKMLTASAIVFGSSMALGLLTSLMGVGLSVCARSMCAEFGKDVTSPADLSKRFDRLEELTDIARELRTISALLGRSIEALPTAMVAEIGTKLEQLPQAIAQATAAGLAETMSAGAADRGRLFEAIEAMHTSLDNLAAGFAPGSAMFADRLDAIRGVIGRELEDKLGSQVRRPIDELALAVAKPRAPDLNPDNLAKETAP